MYSALLLSFAALAAAVTKAPVAAASSNCTALPLGAGPVASPDTDAAFSANTAMSTAAKNAAVPAGYTQAFSALTGATQSSSYLGYTTLSSYSPQTCATLCSSTYGCQAFNTYYERDPVVDPESGANCTNPNSTTTIKCAFFSVPVTSTTAVNAGQYRSAFHVVIAGSNGYTLTSSLVPPPTACSSLNGFTNYYYGAGFTESTPAGARVSSTTLPGSSAQDVCTAVNNCQKYYVLVGGGSFSLYKTGSAGNWVCTVYSTTGSDPAAFNVVNNAVTAAYGYSK